MNNLATTDESLVFKSIGKIESPFKSKFAVPRQSGLIKEIHSKIKIKKSYQPELSLQGLERFSHVWILWTFHLNENHSFKAKVTPPRYEGNKTGVFSTRSPHRPNPIGMSVVEVVEVQKEYIWVKGADLVNSSPILDVKPYIPQYDSIPDAQQGWLELVTDSIDEVKISPEFLAQLEKSFKNISAHKDFKSAGELCEFLMKLIKEDPRPAQQRNDKKTDFVLDIYNMDIFFQIKNRMAEISHFKITKRYRP